MDVDQLAANLITVSGKPYATISVTTQEAILREGGVIQLEFPFLPNPTHAEVSGITPEDLIQIMEAQPNPMAR
jgi:hypothetical protein